MIEIGDIITSSLDVRRVIEVQDDYCIAILIEDIDGAVDQDEDNITEFILCNDIDETRSTNEKF